MVLLLQAELGNGQTTLAATTVYTYDDANRLVNVGGVVYPLCQDRIGHSSPII
jgi:hypothetical protein